MTNCLASHAGRRLAATLAVVLVAAGSRPFASTTVRADVELPVQAPRVIAIGDIHGSVDELITILRRTELIDSALRWSGGTAILVQTGDYMDRGANVRQVMDLMMRLEREAKSAGGQVVTLLGNHEVMNIIGDWRDVSPEICASFATPRSETRRDDGWKRHERWARERTKLTTTVSAIYQQTRDEWMDAHPPGCLEYREAMSPSGTYGRWLREKPIAAQIGDSLFMHAGINPSRPAPRAIADVNARARTEIRRMDAYRQRLGARKIALPWLNLQQILDLSVQELKTATEAIATAKAEGTEPRLDVPLLREAQEVTANIAGWSLLDPEGPMWFRGYAQWPEDTTATQVAAFLDQMKLARIVVGHTPTTDRRVAPRYGGRVVVIDTGMLPAYQGRPSALEISGATLKAIYLDGAVELVSTPSRASRMEIIVG